MKCPQCHKKLETIRTKYGRFYAHTWRLADVLSLKSKLCDYNRLVSSSEVVNLK